MRTPELKAYYNIEIKQYLVFYALNFSETF